MKVVQRPLHPQLRLRPLSLALALAFSPTLSTAQTLPTLPSVVRGTATVSRPAPGQMTVQQGSQSAIINWQSFSIGASGRVTFNQPNAQSVALNRVVGSDPSAIMGTLSANGRVFLVNPNGVLFGAGSSVNVGGLVASTLNIGDDDFMAGRYSFTRGNAARAGVVNEGRIEAAPGGVIALIGSTVDNRGDVSAVNGTAALAAGKTVTLDFNGDGLTQLRVTEADLQTLASSSGTLLADGGRILVLADTTQANGFVVNQSGIVRARSLSGAAGGVVIAGGAGDVSITGSVDTTGGGAGQRGGDVSVSGRNVGLLGSGRIDASGGSGGGHVELLATKTNGEGGMAAILSGASVTSDATSLGNGGRIDFTGAGVRFNGAASARGGPAGGDGGVVKITAGDGLDTTSMRVDTGAPKGVTGTLNIDPYDVTIQEFGASTSPPPGYFDPFTPVGTSTIYTRDINNVLNGGTPNPSGTSNVTITTNTTSAGTGGTIHLGYGSFDTTVIQRTNGSSAVTLRLEADKGIVSNVNGYGSFLISSTAGPLNVEMSANAPGVTGTGISLTGVSNDHGIKILTNGGDVSLFGSKDNSLPASSSSTGVSMTSVTIDTRVGQSDANAGGSVLIRGEAKNNGTGLPAAIDLIATTIRTSTGALSLVGSVPTGSTGDGVRVTASTLATTSGALSVTGLGRSWDAGEGVVPAHGVLLEAASLLTSGAPINVLGNANGNGTGISILAATIDSRVGGTNAGAGGAITIAGTADGDGQIASVGLEASAATISSSSGTLDVNGTVIGSGIGYGANFSAVTLETTTGAISIGGVGRGDAIGLSLDSTSVRSADGPISLHGTLSGSGQGVFLTSSTIDSRVGASNASSGGAITITGAAASDVPARADGTSLSATTITSSTGALKVGGSVSGAAYGSGVVFDSSTLETTSGLLSVNGDGASGGGTAGTGVLTRSSTLTTAAGEIGVTGLGRGNGTDTTNGTYLETSQISSSSGTIDVRGGVDGNVNAYSFGVYLANPNSLSSYGSYVRSTGAVSVAGSVSGNGVGVRVEYDPLLSIGAGNIGGSNITIRAGNGTTSGSDAFQLAPGATINATGVANIRAGGVDIGGHRIERDDIRITLGDVTFSGLVISSTELGQISGSTVVIGSDTYAGSVTLDSGFYGTSFTSSKSLTLSASGSGGSIAIGAPLTLAAGKTLALVAGGAITQSANSPITADELLVRADSATLTAPNNSVGQFAALTGSGALSYLNSRALTLGPVAAIGVAAATDTPVALDASSLIGGTMLVRTSLGNITLAGNIAAGALDLVTPSVFDNSSASTISASDRWHLWAKTWIGETRGGLAGNGALPNLYNCTYGATCATAPAAHANAFIYADSPPLTIVVDDKTRTYGDTNPPLTLTVTGLINGDTAGSIVGESPSTLAQQTSPVGPYTISGAALFANAGYTLTKVSDGTLLVTQRGLIVSANGASRKYGDANPAFTSTVAGLASFDSTTTFNFGYNTSASPTSNVGTYAITPVIGTPNANYSVSLVNGTLAVTPRPLLLGADNAGRLYGDANPAFTGPVTGLASFDTPASVGLVFSSVGPAANVGNYPIVPTLTNTTAVSNYAVTATTGTLAISPAPLTYVADPKTRTILQPDPALTGTVSGLRNGDTVAGATTGTLGWTTNATAASPPGSYSVTGTGLTAQNYVFSQAVGNATALTVTSPSPTEQILAAHFADLGAGSVEPRRDDQSTYVYDQNRGHPQMCVPDSPLTADNSERTGTTDLLAIEWSRLRFRPNVATCFSSGRKGGCNDF